MKNLLKLFAILGEISVIVEASRKVIAKYKEIAHKRQDYDLQGENGRNNYCPTRWNGSISKDRQKVKGVYQEIQKE